MTASRARRGEPIEIGGHVVPPGERLRLDLPVALLPTQTQLSLPVAVIHGVKPGPRIWLSAAVHGDELNGVEIIGRVLDALQEPLARGSILAVPIVNVFGFIGQSRYLPDRRDLNRSFPGSSRGSLASRLASLFMGEIVARCTHGIDLHTAAQDRSNMPQIRADLAQPEVRRIANAFGAPAILHSATRSGSLRAAASARGVSVITYEGGEPQRFNQPVIDIGVRGVFGVLQALGMVPRGHVGKRRPSVMLESSTWIRARRGGLLRLRVDEGATVVAGEELGSVGDSFGAERVPIRAPFRGLILGKTNNPVVHGGDPIVHVGRFADSRAARQ